MTLRFCLLLVALLGAVFSGPRAATAAQPSQYPRNEPGIVLPVYTVTTTNARPPISNEELAAVVMEAITRVALAAGEADRPIDSAARTPAASPARITSAYYVQPAEAPPALTPGASPASQVLHSWLAWIPFITPLFLAGLRLIAPRIPKVWIPTLAGLLPAVVEAVASMSVDGNTALAALLGLAGTGARELTKQLAALPAGAPPAPPAPPAAGMTRAGATYAFAALLALTAVGCNTVIESQDSKDGRFVRVSTPTWPWSDVQHTLGRLNVTVGTNKTTFALRDYDAEADISTNAVAFAEKAAEGFGRGLSRGATGR